AALFLSPREEAGSEGWARPNMTAVGGMWTEGGSDGVFAGNSTIWSGGQFQTQVVGGKFGLELELHGIGEDDALDQKPLSYDLDLTGATAQGRVRLGDSDFWAAMSFAYANVRTHFNGSPAGISGVDPADTDVTIAGPTFSLRYDSFDNVFT